MGRLREGRTWCAKYLEYEGQRSSEWRGEVHPESRGANLPQRRLMRMILGLENHRNTTS